MAGNTKDYKTPKGGKYAKDKSKEGKRNTRGAKGRHGNSSKRYPTDDRYSDASGSDCYADRTNDPSWYLNRGATGLSGTYSWNNVVGMAYPQADSQVPVAGAPNAAWRENATPFTAPGIAIYQIAPMFGSNVGVNVQATPINVAANKLYAYVRHANSGSRNYQKSDLVMYLTAVAEAYSFYGWMGRLYGILNKFSTFNRYWGEALIKALNCKPDNLWKFQTNFKTYMNQYAARLNVLKIPANWPYFLRKYMLYSSVYIDEPSEKAQLFAFQPRCFLKYTRDAGDGHMKLESKVTAWSSLTSTHWSLDDIIAYGNDLINDIILDSDFALMSGDVLKAYPQTFQLPYIAETYVAPFVYDEGINLQIENATIQNIPWGDSNMTVLDQQFDSNGNDALISTFVADSSFTSYTKTIPQTYISRLQKRLLNCHKPSLDEGMLLEATRLTLLPTSCVVNDDIAGQTGKYTMEFVYGYTGTEAISQVVVYTGVGNFGGSMPNVVYTNQILDTTGTGGLAKTATLQQFNVKPTFYLVTNVTNASASTTGVCNVTPMQLLDNYLFLDVDDLRKLHTAALLSLFDVNSGQ